MEQRRLPGLVPRRHGKNVTLWPTRTFLFDRQMRRFDAEAYELRTAPRVPVGAA